MKVVINIDNGGFGLSLKACMRLRELGCPYAFPPNEYIVGEKYPNGAVNDTYFGHFSNIPRNDPLLVQVVEEMKAAAYGSHASLKVVEVPDNVSWEVEEYDGAEWISEVHRTWS